MVHVNMWSVSEKKGDKINCDKINTSNYRAIVYIKVQFNFLNVKYLSQC